MNIIPLAIVDIGHTHQDGNQKFLSSISDPATWLLDSGDVGYSLPGM